MRSAVVTNTTFTTLSLVNVTLKDGNSRSIIGLFHVPANDFRSIPSPVMFFGGIKVSPSATGCYIVGGGQ